MAFRSSKASDLPLLCSSELHPGPAYWVVNCRSGEVTLAKAGCHLHEVRGRMGVILLLTVFDAEPYPLGDGQSLVGGGFLSSTRLY